MWDRLRTPPGHGGEQQKRALKQAGGGIGNGGGGGGGAWDAYSNIPQYSVSITGGPAPPRPPREFLEPQYDDYPPIPGPPPRNPQRNLRNSASSTFRPSSSVYSQPSPANASFHVAPLQIYRRAGEGVSPPSSPEALTPRDEYHHEYSPDLDDISPVGAVPRPLQMLRSDHGQSGAATAQSRSNIPMMRRERRQNQEAASRSLRETLSRERLRQHQPQNHPDALSQRGYKGGEVRWDPTSGELTNSDKGRPSQVKPAEYAKGLVAPGSSGSSAPSRHQESPPAKGAPSFGDRMRRMVRATSKEVLQSDTDPAAGAFTSERPPWHGASGRTALVAPVRDTKEVAPLRIPRKSSKRASSKSPTSLKEAASASGLNISGMTSPPVSPSPGGETQGFDTIRQVVPSSQLAKQQSASPQVHDQAYPSPPSSGEAERAGEPNGDPRAALPSQRQSAVPHPLFSASSPSPSPNNRQVIKRKPAASQQQAQQQQDRASSVYSAGDPYNYNYTTAATPSKPPTHMDWSQPPSRFSVTTYDTTPNESPVPPTLEQFRSSPRPSQLESNSIMDRRRPTLLGSAPGTPKTPPIVISLKGSWHAGSSAEDDAGNETDDTAVASSLKSPNPRGGAGSRIPTLSGAGGSRDSPGSLHKTLPLAPPEQSAKDRVAQLNAQLAGLAQRRVNISRSIKQMTELMPTDNLLAGPDVLRRREAEKRKVEGLRLEMAEIQREEYELGLKLHRAYKRMDRDAVFEPTTLWVRRVTG